MEEVYVLHSMVRRQSTRTQRSVAPKRHRFVQRIGGGEITVRRGKNRGTKVTKALLEKYLEDIKQRVDEGQIEVRTLAGQVVDLSTMKAAPVAPSKPLPDPVLAVEELGTSHVPVYEEGKGMMEEVEPPSTMDDELPEGELPEEEEL